MGVSLAIEDFVRVAMPLLMDVSRIKLAICFLAEDHLRCWIAVQKELVFRLVGQLTKCQHERSER
jgi:hypothetical protein